MDALVNLCVYALSIKPWDRLRLIVNFHCRSSAAVGSMQNIRYVNTYIAAHSPKVGALSNLSTSVYNTFPLYYCWVNNRFWISLSMNESNCGLEHKNEFTHLIFYFLSCDCEAKMRKYCSMCCTHPFAAEQSKNLQCLGIQLLLHKSRYIHRQDILLFILRRSNILQQLRWLTRV